MVAAATEPLPGTAPHRPVWALVEHPGPWGRDAPLDAPWPDPELGRKLQHATDAAGIRLVLARRHGREGQAAEPGRQVLIARTGPDGGLTRLTLDDATDLPQLPWADLAAASATDRGVAHSKAGPMTGPVWAVCTQGTRDACCARLGRPIATAFVEAGQDVWEISHSGGHRFAGVVLELPSGLLYGRVTPDDVTDLIAAERSGELVPHLLRGAVHRAPGLQAAEAALRAELGEPGRAALQLDDAPAPGSNQTDLTTNTDLATSTWRHAPSGTSWQVTTQEQALAPRSVSCGKPAEAGTGWVVTELSRLSPPGRTNPS